MTLYIWMDEHGKWRCSHFLPEGESVLMVALGSDTDIALFDRSNGLEEVVIEVQPR